MDDLWVADHIAIPPDDAEGSVGRYLDPLATLAFLAAPRSASDSAPGSSCCRIGRRPFLFRPRRPRPPIFVGGAAPHALRRAARFGDGWMPMGGDAAMLRPLIAHLRQQMAAAGKATTEVVVMTSLPLDDRARAAAQLQELAALGATRVVHAWRYADAAAFAAAAALLRDLLPVG